MTRDDQNNTSNQGELPDTGTDLTRAQKERLDRLPGRGARHVPGAHPSDEYVENHVDGVGEQGPDLLDPTKPHSDS